MESPMLDSKNAEVTINTCTSSSSNQFIPDNLELPDDTFRMGLDNFSMIGENVTIGREMSVDSSVASNAETPTVELPTPMQTPDTQTPDIESPKVQTPPLESYSPPIIETPKLIEAKAEAEIRRPQTLLQLSLSKKNDNDVFVKPSPVAELMSPARMLQFEVEASSATPTMKRAAVDFDFFSKNNFEEYFVESEPKDDRKAEDPGDGSTYKETPVIVKADTVRHEIGYVNLNGAAKVDISHFDLLKVLGTGAYGKVFLVRKRCGIDEGKLYAMKVLKKASIVQKLKTAEHTRTERQVLEAVRACPFLVTLHYAFQTDAKLHLILDYVAGGELFTHLYQREHFNENEVRIYIAEIILALEQLHKLLDLEWWIYLFIVLSFFMTCLGLNYVVKKINEAKIDERFIRLLHKASTTQATQVNGPLIVMETTKGIRQNSSRSAQPSPTGISLVFNQEDNKRKQDLDETYNIIKNSIDPKRFDSLSLNSKFSQETVDLPMTKTEHYINEIVTNKIIESAHKVNTAAPKETSSLAQNNCNGTDIKTVLVKKNEYGYPSIKETTSTDRSDCYITEVMAVTKNDAGFVPAKRALPTTDYNRREIIALKDTERIIAKETTYLIQSDNNDRDKDAHNPKTKSSDKSENEAASSGPRSADDNEPSAIKKPDPNRTVAKPNVPGMKITESKIREAITKAKEEIDAINLKKKALESSLERNPDATATNKEGSLTNKTAGSIFVKETLPKSGRVVTESSPVKLSDFGNSNAKNYSSHIHGHATEKPVKISDSSQLRPLKISDSDATKNISSHAISIPNVIANPLKPNKSGQLAAKDTSLHIKNVNSSDKLSSPKKTEHIATKITSPNTRTDQKVSREVTEKKTDKKEENVVSDTSPAHTQSHRHDPAIHSAVPATKSEPRHLSDQVPPNVGNVHKEAVEKPDKIKSEHITATPIASPDIGREAAKPKSMQPHSDQKDRDGVTVKKDLHTTTTAPHYETHTNIAKETIKKSEHGQEAVKPTPLHPRGDHKDKQDVTGTKELTGHALTATHSHTQTDHSVDPTKKTEFQREAVKATSLGHGVKKNEDIAGKIDTVHNVPAIIPTKMNEQVPASQTVAHHPANEGLAIKKEEKRTVRRTAKDTTSSGTQTDPKITKFGKRYESDRKDIKGLSTLARSDPKPVEGLVKIEKAGPIAATETVFHPQTDHTATGIIPVTMSGRIAAKQITVNTPSNRNVTELVPIKMSIPTNKALNNEGETATGTQRSDVGNIKINEPVPITIERNVPGISAITKPNTPTHSSTIPKKTIDPNVSQSEEPQGTNENSQTGLKERLKALLSPPVLNEDVMVLKPSPSSKK